MSIEVQEAKDALERLRKEGYSHVFVWTDLPDTVYPDHTHATDTAHIVLEGSIAISVGEDTQTYGPGDRFDVPAETIHSAQVESSGCTYVVGER